MKLARALNMAETKRVQNLILFGGAITTLAMWTQLEDPINLPKMFVLVLSGAAILGLVLPALFALKNLTFKNQKVGLIIIGLGLIVVSLNKKDENEIYFYEITKERSSKIKLSENFVGNFFFKDGILAIFTQNIITNYKLILP